MTSSDNARPGRVQGALRVCALTWLSSVAMGLWFALLAGGLNPLFLFLPAVFPIAVAVSTVVAIPLMPIAVWASRTGRHNIRRYSPLLLAFLAAYAWLAGSLLGRTGVYLLPLIAAIGLVAIGFIPPRD